MRVDWSPGSSDLGDDASPRSTVQLRAVAALPTKFARRRIAADLGRRPTHRAGDLEALRTACSRWCGELRRAGWCRFAAGSTARSRRRDRRRSRPSVPECRTVGRGGGRTSTVRSIVTPAIATPWSRPGAQQRLDARHPVRDPVERHALGGLALLDREPVGYVIGRDDVERARRQARPHRCAVVGGAERR